MEKVTKYNTMIKSLKKVQIERKERDLGKLIVQTKSSNNSCQFITSKSIKFQARI